MWGFGAQTIASYKDICSPLMLPLDSPPKLLVMPMQNFDASCQRNGSQLLGSGTCRYPITTGVRMKAKPSLFDDFGSEFRTLI